MREIFFVKIIGPLSFSMLMTNNGKVLMQIMYSWDNCIGYLVEFQGLFRHPDVLLSMHI